MHSVVGPLLASTEYRVRFDYHLVLAQFALILFYPAAALARWETALALYAARPGQLPPLWTVEACPSLPSLLAGVYPAMS
jgi:hypothetical protein